MVDRHILSSLFAPKSIVVFAGDPDSDEAPTPLARTLRRALIDGGYTGPVTWLDISMTGTLADLAASRADLALIALPPEQIPAALEIVGRIRCRAALIVSSGLPLEACSELHQVAKRYGVHLLGPNSMGFQRPSLKLNASALGPLAAPGPLGLISQSGALTASILDWARHNGIGFSNVISLGPNTAVDLPQALDFLANDGQTQSILVYMEGIRHARRFMSALRAAAYAKPVVVMKAGRKPAGSHAALTHSASIVGADDVFDAALRRAGVVRVRTFVQLFSAAKCLASRFRPVGKRLAIITNGGGPGVLAADWADEIGLEVAGVADLGEDADGARYREALQQALADRGADGILLIYSPKAGEDPLAIAQAIGEAYSPSGKPVLSCWMGDTVVRPAREYLASRLIPTFRTPEAAVDAFHSIASFYRNQQLLQQTPASLSHLADPDTEGARLLIEGVLTERRRVLTEMESKALLAAFHIPVTRTMLARTPNEAMLIASQLGYPVALKIDSPDISHKSDVKGVALDVHSAAQVRDRFNDMMEAVRRAMPSARINGITVQPMAGRNSRGKTREVYVGLTTDDPFGPVITFGAGGTMIELIADRAMELPPLNQFLAHRLIERARVAESLGEWRGALPADIQALEQVLLRVSEMVCELPQLREMDINPIIVDENGAVAVDARIVIDHSAASPHSYNHLAILPYPSSQEREWPMKGGGLYTIRPIRPDDADMLQSFVRGLSEESRYFRFASTMPELPARMLARYTLIDYDREMALVAVLRERHVAEDGSFHESERIIGVSRYITNPDQTSCEFSLAVADEFKGQGLGSRLMLSIIDFARAKGLAEIEGLILANNANMLRLMKSLGFTISPFPEDPDFKLAAKTL
ncbi:bifunctional acetate--CoA ligase family protein/GNAT family N-acetyltransferase [Rubrivivax benzoatilyticus]|uniref:Bifunctional acetate--CoA ligase family protein/GNAT family N-acetyltransferase n=1 Tax=Rubrivivax benzoatilyticus TaxID=316997 RepID=A0ABX0HPD8_9BURK|nr:bifunctional acetate--CoA ligase family protein/GNAT family N-acetyltransferase [Rubrivivax benzoatilyticus]NHL24668.1 bifunctional acetate--CoA ligase family protein/GNAT family N-acetyltransferase [Rubrivivax benzoatilyticus]